MCGGLFSFCFLHETVFGNGQIAIMHNVKALLSVAGIEKQKLNSVPSAGVAYMPC